MSTEDLVTVARSGGVAVLTLNVPDRRNVLSADLVRAIGDAFDRIEADPSSRCVVVTGAGSAFCAGAELSTLSAAAAGDFDRVRVVYDGFLRVLRSPLVTIAAVNGPAVGAGFNLALACDIRLGSPRALFDTRFAQLRLHPGGGHTWLLARAVGQQHTTMATVFGEVWDGEQALARGLIAGLHPEADLLPAATALGARLDGQEREYTEQVIRTVRAAVTTLDHETALVAETRAQEWSAGRAAFRDGVAAMLAAIERRRSR